VSQPFAPYQSEDFKRLWAAQEGVCAVCGTTMPATRFEVAHATLWKKWRPTMDHIKASANGGRNSAPNLQLAHALCNKRKGRS
jgi:5-methylcytosine-specific restriction endonuclease McrA